MGNYRLTEDAKEDLKRIYGYGVITHGEKQADIYLDALFERFQHIADDPYFYPSVDYIRRGYRRSICGVDSVFYRIVDDTVEIVAIIGRQDIDNIL